MNAVAVSRRDGGRLRGSAGASPSRMFMGIVAVIWIGLCSVATAQTPQPNGPPDVQTYVESAVYDARLVDDALTNGTATLRVAKRGDGVGQLDWSRVTLAVTSLTWRSQPAVWGTGPDGRIVVLTGVDDDELTLTWSRRGRVLDDLLVFDLNLPPALDGRLRLRLPADRTLTSSEGLVNSAPEAESGERLWTIELGRARRTLLQIGAKAPADPPTFPCETTTTYAARRDGLLLQQEFVLPPGRSDGRNLILESPAGVRVQSVTVNGEAVPFAPQQNSAGATTIDLPPRSGRELGVLLVRGVVEFPLGELLELPRLRLRHARETRRRLVLTIEEPLQVRELLPVGMFQTDLTREAGRGEVWRFEARRPEGSVRVRLNEPPAEVSARIQCLTDQRNGGSWAAMAVDLTLSEGARFESVLKLPPGWDLVTVQGSDANSEIAGHRLRDGRLEVYWRSPLQPETPKSLHLFLGAAALPRGVSVNVPLPEVEGAVAAEVTHQFLLPNDLEVRLVESEGWRVTDENEVGERLAAIPEVRQRLASSTGMAVSTLAGRSGLRSDELRISLLERPPSLEAQFLRNRNRNSAAAPPASGNESPPATDIRLRSYCGPLPGHASLHFAELILSQPMTGGPFSVNLASEARISTVSVDGTAVQVVRTGGEILFPADLPPFQRITFAYSVQPTSAWWRSTHHVPVPRTRHPVANFRWTVEMRGSQQLAHALIPPLDAVPREVEPLTSYLFGPLSRGANDTLFRPWRGIDWATWFTQAATASDSTTPREVIDGVFPLTGDEVILDTWSPRQALQWSWISFWIAFLLGIWIRREHPEQQPRAMPGILAVLGLLLVWLPATGTPIVGGAFTGLFLTLLVPRWWIRPRAAVAGEHVSSAAWAGRSPALATIAAWAMLLGGTWTLAQPPSVAVNLPAAPSLPRTLISQARYEVVQSAPVPRIVARWTVWTRTASSSTLLRLPLRNVVIDSPTACRLDGQVHELIPSGPAGGVLVSIPARGEPAAPQLGLDFVPHELELAFDLRSGGLAGDPLIPAVLQSEVSLPDAFAASPLAGRGASRRQTDGVTIELGALGRLNFSGVAPELSQPDSLRAVTWLELSELNVSGETTFAPGDDGFPGEFRVELPPGVHPRAVTGPDVEEWLEIGESGQGSQLSVRLRRTGSPDPIRFQFDLPPTVRASQMSLPAFGFAGAQPFRHTLGLNAPAAVALAWGGVRDGRQLTAEEWRSAAATPGPRPTLAIQLDSPQPLNLVWTTLESARTARVSEVLDVRREVLWWTADVELTVSRAPTFSHRFSLDPRVALSSVTSGDADGVVQNLRFVRSGGDVSVFLPHGQLGVQSVRFEGQLRAPVDQWTTIPQFGVWNAVTASSDFALLNSSDWNVDYTLPAAAGSEPETPSEEFAQPLDGRADFPQGSRRPELVRTSLPPWEVRADSVVLLRLNPGQPWEIVTQIRLSAAETLLHRAVLRIPHEFETVQLGNEDLEYAFDEQEEYTDVTVTIPDRLAGAVTISLTAQLGGDAVFRVVGGIVGSGESTELPMIEVPSAQMGSQFVLLENQSPLTLAPSQSLQVSGASFPAWANETWREAVRDGQLQCFQRLQPGGGVEVQPRADTLSKPTVWLDETALWQLPGGGLRGVSRLWIENHRAEFLEMEHDDALSVEWAQIEGQQSAAVSRTAEGSRISIVHHSDITPLVVYWSASPGPTGIALPKYEGVAPAKRLWAVVSPQTQLAAVDDDLQLSELNAWLLRWEALLNCVQNVTASVSVDASLLANIRLSRSRCASLLNSTDASILPEQRELFGRLTDRWARVQERLFQPAVPDPDPEFPLSGALAVLLEQPDPHRQVDVFSLDSVTRIRIESTGLELAAWRPRLAGSLAIILLLGLAWRFPDPLERLRQALAEVETDRLLVLGLIWWAFFTGSGYAFLVVLATIVLVAGARIADRVSAWRTEAVSETVGPPENRYSDRS